MRRFAVVAIALLIGLCAAAPVLAQGPNFPDFSSAAGLTTNGTNVTVPFDNGTAKVLRINPADYYQVGSAWFNTLQPVNQGFSTTFTFQITPPAPVIVIEAADNPPPPPPPFPADGIAFVIQSAGTNALGQAGGYLGYGGLIPPSPDSPGIKNSVAIEFDTYPNPWDDNIANVAPANHVAVQSCAFAENTVDHSQCNLGIATAPVNLSDGNPHVVHIEYFVPPSDCNQCGSSTLQVTIDGMNVFAAPIPVNLGNLMTLAGANLDSAYVGFTGATGASAENNDILNWTFSSHGQTITQPAPAGTFTTYTFGTFLYKVKPNQSLDALSITAVPTDPATFAADRQANHDFPGAQCIVYDTTGGKCVEFHAACSSPSNNACSNVSYDVATSYDVPANSPPITNPGFLKATGQECTPGIAFDLNIITQFTQTRTDPTTKGSSKPSFSCFAAVQNVTYQPADLDILNIGPLKAKPNSNITYVATATNFGPSGAQGVALTNTLPSGTSYVSSSLCTLTGGCSSTACSFDGTTVSCPVGNLDKFNLEFMVVTVKVTAPAGSYISDTARVNGFNPDPDKVPDRSSTLKTQVSNK